MRRVHYLPEWQKRLDWFGKILEGRNEEGGYRVDDVDVI